MTTKSLALKSYLSKHNIFDYLIVLGVGLGIFLYFYSQSSPRLAGSDEIVYAVMGRNIATGRGVISNYYYLPSILERGYPLGDIHMPGYSLILGLSFWLLGEVEYAAFVPNYISFLAGGLLLYWLGKKLFNRWTGFGSAFVFYTFLPVIIYTFTAMSELTLVLLSIIFLVIWYKSLVEPGLSYSFALAVVMIAGLLHHETFLIFLPPALYALWRWPKQERLRAGLYFGLIFALLFCILFVPFYLDRAPYPNFLSNVFTSPAIVLNILKTNVKTFLALGEFDRSSYLQLSFQLHLLFLLVTALGFFALDDIQKKVCLYSLYCMIGSIVGLIAIYSFSYRVVIHLLPPTLVLLVGLMSNLKQPWLKNSLILVLICFVLFVSQPANSRFVRGRQDAFASVTTRTETITGLIDRFSPETILIDSDFMYGWTHYPITVIWFLSGDNMKPILAQQNRLDAEVAQKLSERISIDVIAVSHPIHVKQMQASVQEGLLSVDYSFVGVGEEYHIFVKSALINSE